MTRQFLSMQISRLEGKLRRHKETQYTVQTRQIPLQNGPQCLLGFGMFSPSLNAQMQTTVR